MRGLPAGVEQIDGAQELYDWFGYWPAFHDAEVLRFQLNLKAPCHLSLHTWEMTSRVDERGFYELTKHVVVDFTLTNVSALNFVDPWERSILLDLTIERTGAGFRLDLSSSYGLSGSLEAEHLSLRLKPGRPNV